MTTALEERVDRLEQTVDHLATKVVKPLQDRVEQLETWAGPSQNEGFSANLVKIRKSLAALNDGQAVLGGMLVENTQILGGHTETLAGHTETLDQHTNMLNEQSQTLSKHGETLDNHTRTLDNHTHTLDNHTGLLNEILLRLPPRPEQSTEQPSRM